MAESRLEGDELTAEALAESLGIPLRTTRRWLASWYRLGVSGVRMVPSRGRTGLAFRASADLPARWLACELPAPRLAA